VPRLLLLLLVLASAPLLFAQRVPVGAEGARISAVEMFVKSEGQVFERAPDSAPRHRILEAMRTRQGGQFSSDALSKDITYLTTTSHLFADVGYDFDFDSEANTLRVKLIFSQPLVWRIRVVAPLRGTWTEDGVKDFWRARSQMDTAEDGEFSITRLDADIKRMYATATFLDIRAEYAYTEKGVDLLFRVIQNEPLAIVQFSGVYQSGYTSSLERVIAGVEAVRELPSQTEEGTLVSPRYFPRGAFDGDIITDANPANILGATQQIQAYYRMRGFAFVEARPKLISLPLKFNRAELLEGYGQLTESTLSRCESLIGQGYGGRLVLIFEVHEGPELLVGTVRFTGLGDVRSPGNDALEGSRISGMFGSLYAFWYRYLGSAAAEQAAALAEEMRTKAGEAYVQADVVRDAETLQTYFRARGWLDARVSFANFELNETRTRMNLVFHVEPGSPYAITNIRLEYGTRSPRVPQGAEPEEFDEPVITWEELFEFLRLEGNQLSPDAAKARFGPEYVDENNINAQGRWFVSYELDEPIAYDTYALTGDIMAGADGYAGAIRALLASKGYSNIEVEFVRVDTQGEFVETGWKTPWPARRTELILRIQQGYKSYVGTVNIRGNDVTRDSVVRRNITLYPGEVFNRNEQRGSDIRLRRTQWFEQGAPGQGVSSRTTPRLVVTADGIIEYTDIDYDLIEGRTNSFNFAAGFNSSTGFTASVDLTLRNFDISSLVSWLWGEPNFSFTGAGQTLTFTAQPPLDRQQIYRISFDEPWLWGYPLGGGVSAEYSTIDRGDYTRERTGIDPYIAWRVTPDVVWRFGYSYEIFNIRDIASDAPDTIREDSGRSILSTVWSEIRWTTTDNPYFPTTGFDLSYRYSYTGGLFGGTLDFWNMRGSASLYLPMAQIDDIRTLVLALNVSATWQDVHSNTKSIPFSQRLLLGGNSASGRGSLRGFEFAGVGPSRNDIAIGGNFMVTAFAELRFPIFPGNLWFVTFIDVGELSPTLNTFDPEGWTVSGGFGLRLLLPILPVPFALDFGFPILNQPGNREEVISINLGFGF
jgi:outer membrane protein assembly factor BamA